MPKFAANLTLLFTETEFLQRFERAHKAGFRAVEYLFPYDYPAQQLAEKLQQFELQQALFNLYPGDWAAGERGLAALPGREQEFAESVEQALAYAQALNCPKVHAMSGVVDSRYSREQHEQTFINNIRQAADRFGEHGIEVMIEPLNNRDMPGYFIGHQRETAQLIERVGRSNVKLQFDLYHAQIMDGDLTVLLRELASIIGHVQIASVPDRHEPPLGELNDKHLIATLDEIGYRGWIGCEYYPQTTTEAGLYWLDNYSH